MENELIIREASSLDLNIIIDLAEKIWWPTYSAYLSEEQIRCMLKDLYAPQALLMEMNRGIHYAIADFKLMPVGFLAYGSHEIDPTTFRIEKLYILPEMQGLGVGSQLINYVERFAKRHGSCFLELNVNRNNPAMTFYIKKGFSITKKIDIPYRQYVLNDYVMKKRLS